MNTLTAERLFKELESLERYQSSAKTKTSNAPSHSTDERCKERSERATRFTAVRDRNLTRTFNDISVGIASW